MWNWFGRSAKAELPEDHSGCRIAMEAKDALIAELKLMLTTERTRNEDLHVRTLEMHGYGHAEHMRALKQRESLGPVAVKLAEQGNGDLQAELESVIAHAEDVMENPQPLETHAPRNGDTVDSL